MKPRIIRAGLGLAVCLAIAACDWTTDVEYWSEEYNWVNFDGVYRGRDGGLLVTDYTHTPPTEDTVYRVNNERIATGDGSTVQFSGVLRNKPLVIGSLTISVPGYQLVDQGNAVLIGSGKTGTIDYGTGAWSVDMGDYAPPVGAQFLANYEYVIGGTGAGGPGSGASGRTIYSFTVFQEGNLLRIVDNNGAVYEGRLGSVRGTGATIGSEIIAQFNARGISAANVEVNITGTFQGVVSGTVGALSLSDRRLYGTWIETDGRTGDIIGYASPGGMNAP